MMIFVFTSIRSCLKLQELFMGLVRRRHMARRDRIADWKVEQERLDEIRTKFASTSFLLYNSVVGKHL